MAKKAANPTKELYQQLRQLPWLQLWQEEVPRFTSATSEEKTRRVALIRAVGAGFADAQQAILQEPVRQWLLSLLRDPSEKVRRYAMAALPKIGAGQAEESQLLALLQTNPADREKKFLGKALEKIGGSATLDLLRHSSLPLSPFTEQRAKANLARTDQPSSVLRQTPLSLTDGRIHLRCRTGLESILSREIQETHLQGKVMEIAPGRLTFAPAPSFRLDDFYALRTFATLSFYLGTVPPRTPAANAQAIATLITSPQARQILQTLTLGPIRYRLEFMAHGHQSGAVRQIVQQAYSLWPDFLNDSRQAPWAIEVHPSPSGGLVELRPRLTPDPRFPYRLHDVPAASHPPLAAAMARLAGPFPQEVLWDPFCGSGLELIERARLGGVARVLGTDLSPTAIEATRLNWQHARLPGLRPDFFQKDFREFSKFQGYGPASITLLITNPPLGKRVPIPNLRELLEELFSVASFALRPGGRMVWVNPLKIKPLHSDLRLEFQQTIDLGGFSCRLELYRKL